MATYPIFTTERGERIAINPDCVVSLAEIPSGRVNICLPDAGLVTVKMTLEDVIARLTGARELSGA
jgi:hypothetical protein